ncbi:diguanylate cyclase (GGDEF) domain-containing protein [Burkholderiales bacterium JOSHI_001]|nr:diguanylate cyclase (GGDEF) domain-containing protein [Burkholderiales bacterium JOSHI_001]
MMPMPDPDFSRSLARLLHTGALLAVTVLALAVPGVTWWLQWEFAAGALDGLAASRAYLISQRVNANPQAWRQDSAALSDLVRRPLLSLDPDDRRRLLDPDRHLITGHADFASGGWPRITRHVDIHDGGRLVARLEVQRSLQAAAGLAAATGLAALGLGWAALAMLHRRPLRHLRAAEDGLKQLAFQDALTGLSNREHFRARLADAVSRAQANPSLVAVLSVDLDHFKAINDAEGHDVGDGVLREAAERLRRGVRASDLVARVGGDEFAVLLEGLNAAEDAERVADGLIVRFARPFVVGGRDHHLSCSVGVSVHPRDASEPDRLLAYAGTAMQNAKRAGRNTHRSFCPQMQEGVAERLRTEADLRQALAKNEFVLYYQPLVDMRARCTRGAEALLRWRHPQRGMVPPGEFIEALESLGLIHAVGEWVMHEACAQTVRWIESGLGPLQVSVNVSPLQFARGAVFVAQVQRILLETGLRPDLLQLEVTEGHLMADNDRSLAMLKELRALGVTLAIDDFGTGYSSLAYLSHFPVNTLKVDRSFVNELALGDGSSNIVKAIVQLGHNLGLGVTAEGIETDTQLQALAAMGCDVAQGYLLGRPMPAPDFSARMVAEVREEVLS